MLVAPSLENIGGQAVQASRLLAYLNEEPSLEVSLFPINPRLPGKLSRLQGIKYLRTVATLVGYCSRLPQHVRAHDVIQIFSAAYFSFLLSSAPAILVARLYGKRIVLNYRSGEAEDHLARWGPVVNPMLRLCDIVAVPSGYLVDVFARFGLSARAIVNVVDTERFRFRERRPLRPVFLANRHLEPLYNVACVLRAFARIQEQVPEARLLVAGDGSQRGALEGLAAELKLRHVQWLGRVAPEAMPALYDAADIYLNAPDLDNMPGSILEAFASGLPVVTSDAGGIPYIVTHEATGLLVPRGDHEALAAAALRLLQDEALAARLASQALAECRKYRWPAVRSEWLDLYHGLAAARRQRWALSSGLRAQGSELGAQGPTSEALSPEP
jgi:glycosyltransferase involved in cell wall biosynthesis